MPNLSIFRTSMRMSGYIKCWTWPRKSVWTLDLHVYTHIYWRLPNHVEALKCWSWPWVQHSAQKITCSQWRPICFRDPLRRIYPGHPTGTHGFATDSPNMLPRFMIGALLHWNQTYAKLWKIEVRFKLKNYENHKFAKPISRIGSIHTLSISKYGCTNNWTLLRRARFPTGSLSGSMTDISDWIFFRKSFLINHLPAIFSELSTLLHLDLIDSNTVVRFITHNADPIHAGFTSRLTKIWWRLMFAFRVRPLHITKPTEQLHVSPL